jgi:hypothetical protein
MFNLFGYLKNLFCKSEQPKSKEDILLESLGKGVCPDCQGREFYFGPHGGVSQNIKCVNPECNSEFCVAPFDDGWCGTPLFAERTFR